MTNVLYRLDRVHQLSSAAFRALNTPDKFVFAACQANRNEARGPPYGNLAIFLEGFRSAGSSFAPA